MPRASGVTVTLSSRLARSRTTKAVRILVRLAGGRATSASWDHTTLPLAASTRIPAAMPRCSGGGTLKEGSGSANAAPALPTRKTNATRARKTIFIGLREPTPGPLQDDGGTRKNLASAQDAELPERLGDPSCQGQGLDLRLGDPAGFPDVASRLQRPAEHRHEIVDDDVVEPLVDPLDEAGHLADLDLEPGLLEHLPAHRLRQRLAPFDPASGDRPQPLRWRCAPTDEQDGPILPGDAPHTHDRASGRFRIGAHAVASERRACVGPSTGAHNGMARAPCGGRRSWTDGTRGMEGSWAGPSCTRTRPSPTAPFRPRKRSGMRSPSASTPSPSPTTTRWARCRQRRTAPREPVSGSSQGSRSRACTTAVRSTCSVTGRTRSTRSWPRSSGASGRAAGPGPPAWWSCCRASATPSSSTVC